jgi:hypothetical protein
MLVDGREVMGTSAGDRNRMEVRGIGDHQRCRDVRGKKHSEKRRSGHYFRPWNEVTDVDRLGMEQGFVNLGIDVPYWPFRTPRP